MHRVVDRHGFRNAIHVSMCRIDLPTRFLFDQRQEVRRVSVHLIGGDEYENCLGSKLARRFEQRQRSVGIHREINERLSRRPVMGRLSGRVHNQFDLIAVGLKNPVDVRFVANIHVVVNVTAHFALQAVADPGGRRFLTEEFLAHTVVDSDDVHSLVGEVSDGFRSNQSRRSGNDCHAHGQCSSRFPEFTTC